MDNALKLLGLAHKAGRLAVGEEPVGAAARARKAKLLILAADAAPNTVRRAAHFGEAGSVLFLTTPFTKAELGFAVGRGSCAMLAFTDPGFAAAFMKKLAALDPERYAPAAEQTRHRADRALQRQKEQRQHEKNLERGKKRPWAPPPPPPLREEPRPPRRGASSRPPKPSAGHDAAPPRKRGGPSPAGRSKPAHSGARPVSRKGRRSPNS